MYHTASKCIIRLQNSSSFQTYHVKRRTSKRMFLIFFLFLTFREVSRRWGTIQNRNNRWRHRRNAFSFCNHWRSGAFHATLANWRRFTSRNKRLAYTKRFTFKYVRFIDFVRVNVNEPHQRAIIIAAGSETSLRTFKSYAVSL